MTSLIRDDLIVTNFPQAGRDNNSEGFRTNFAATAAGLGVAKTEISALQQSAVLAVDLATGTLPVVNDLLGSTISNGVYNKFYGKYYAATNNTGISGASSIDVTNGAVQKFVLNGDAVLTFTGWPASGNYAKCKVIISANGGVWHPTFQTSNSGTVVYEASSPLLAGTTTPGITVGGEKVASVTISGSWTGFSPQTTTVTFSAPGQGIRATGTVTTDGSGVITGVVITNPGSGYASAPSCTITDNDSGLEVSGTAISVLTTTNADNIKVIDAWTVDGGSHVYLKLAGEY